MLVPKRLAALGFYLLQIVQRRQARAGASLRELGHAGHRPRRVLVLSVPRAARLPSGLAAFFCCGSPS